LSKDNSFAARVARVALLRGISIKPISLDFVAKQVRADREDDMSEAEIYAGLKKTAEATPIHFGLPPAKPTGNPRERAINDLDRENSHAEFVRHEKAPSSKIKLTDEERERFKRWGPSAMLDEANLKAGTRPYFIDESNDDE